MSDNSIQVTIDQDSRDRINKALKQLDPAAEDGAIKRGVLAATTYVLQVLLDNVSGIVLKIRTGNLARSMGMRVERDGNDWMGVCGSGALVVNPELSPGGTENDPVKADKTFRMIYADILETGGTIVPVNKQFLAIPIGDALTPAGVPRFTAQQLKDGATNYEGSVIIGGIIFGLSQTKKRSNMTPLFALKTSVTIPAKRYLSTTADQVSGEVGEVMAEAIENILEKESQGS